MKVGSSPFLKKRTKKLLIIGDGTNRQKSFASFLQKRSAFFLLLLIIAGCTPTLRPPDVTDIQRISAYLDNLPRLEARFTQTGDFGPGAGLIWLDRPGHLRIDYAGAASRVMVIANGRVRILDRGTGALTTQPVSRTPLGLLLGPQVDLAKDAHVESLTRTPGQLRVVLTKPGAPTLGTLTLDFADQPLLLEEVSITDPNRRTLTLRLSGLDPAPRITPDLFAPPMPPPPT